MSKTKISSAIAFASVLMASLPAFAGGISTESNQTANINGSGNYVNMNSSQNVNNSNNGSNNVEVKLRNQQFCNIAGNNNACINNSQQRVDFRNGYYPGKKTN